MNKSIYLLILILNPIFAFSQRCIYIKDHNQQEISTTIDCGFNFFNSCVRLDTDFPTLKNTDNYQLPAVDYNPFDSFAIGNPIQANEDDRFVKKVNLNEIGNKPFLFNFYGKKQNTFVISSNGFISFDPTYEVGDFSTPDFNNQQIPSNYLPKSSIFGSFQDLSFYNYEDSEIYIDVKGEYPCRTLIVNFYKGIIAGTNQTSTFQIVLHEMTSQIDIHIAQKPLPNTEARFKSSLIGITDENGNGIAPNNRNTGVWSATEESYTFVPNGADLVPQTISWSNTNNDVLPNGSNLLICQIKPSVYTATATYSSNINNSFTIANDHQILVSPNYPIAKDYTYNICDISSELRQQNFYSYINQQSNPEGFRYKFYTNRNDAQSNLSNFLRAETLLDYQSVYYVRIENQNDENCFQIAQLTIDDSFEFPDFFEICDNNNDLVENYTLSKLNCKVLANIPEATNIRYYVNNSSSISTTANLTNTSTIRVKFDTRDCRDIISNPISIRFLEAPVTLVDEINFDSYEILFDIVTNNNPTKQEDFNWIDYLQNLGIDISNTSLANAKVYKTYNDAVARTGNVNFILEGNPEYDYRYTWYLRIDNGNSDCIGNCYSIIPIKLRVKFRKLILNISDADTDLIPDSPSEYDNETADVYLCATQNYTLNLSDDVRRLFNITTHNWNQVKITYHLSYASANNLNSEGISATVASNDLTDKIFYVRVALNNSDFVVKELKYHFLPTKPLKQQFDICVDYFINAKEIQLRDYITQLIESKYLSLLPNPIIEFYSDEDLQNRIETLQVGRDYSRIWVKIKHTIAENSCEGIYPLDFKIVSVDNILKNYHEENIICDNNLDGFEIINLKDFLNNYVTDQSQYNFKFYLGYNSQNNTFSREITNPENYRLDSSRLVYIAISSVGGSAICSQKVELKINFNPDPLYQIYANQEANLVICNQINTPTVSFNLNEAIPQFFTNQSYEDFITNIKFFENYNDAFVGNNNYIQLANTYELIATQPNKIIYVRFENSYGCFNIKPLNLTILGFIKFKNNLSIDVCDNNLDGLYEFQPQHWINSATQDDDYSNDLLTDRLANRFASYKIYLSEEDYINGRAVDTNQIILLNPTIHRSIIISGELNGGCDDHISIHVNYNETIIHSFEMDPICDDENDEIEVIDLRVFESQFSNSTIKYYRSLSDLNTETNEINTPSHYTFNALEGEYIYGKIENENSCPNFFKIKITLIKKPIITIPNLEICLGDTITITPDYKDWSINTYEWRNSNNEIVSSTNSLTTDQIGDFILTITSTNGCSTSTAFKISYKPTPNFIELLVNENNIIVKASGNKTILYSLDQINWQESNTFENLGYGPFKVYLKYVDVDCITGPYRTIIPKIHNTISPNGDSVNEKWILDDMDVFNGKKAELKIFDRFGKVLYTQQSDRQLLWDGKLNGKPLPSTSYWYIIQFPDGRKYTGYINVLNKY